MQKRKHEVFLQRKRGVKESREEKIVREQLEKQCKWEKKLSKESPLKLYAELASLQKAEFLTPQQKERKRLVMQMLEKMKLFSESSGVSKSETILSNIRSQRESESSKEVVPTNSSTAENEISVTDFKQSCSDNIDNINYDDLFRCDIAGGQDTSVQSTNSSTFTKFIPRSIRKELVNDKKKNDALIFNKKIQLAEQELLDAGKNENELADIDELFELLDHDEKEENHVSKQKDESL